MPHEQHASGRRWLRALGALALSLALIAALAVLWALDRVPADDVEAIEPGRLSVSEQALGEWLVGGVRVTITESGLQMVDGERDDLVVWESGPNRAFLMAVLGDVAWTEHRGYFWADTRHECELVDQDVRSATDDGGRLQVSGVLSGCGQQREFTIDVLEGDVRGDVVLDVVVRNVDALSLVTARTPDTGVHGFGEQFAPFDLSGTLTPIVVREQGVGRGEQPLTVLADVTNRGAGGTEQMTYAAWPSFVTGDVRGLALDPAVLTSHAFAVADATSSDSVVLTSWAPELRAELTADADPLALLQRRAAGDTRPSLPRWVGRGAVLGIQGGTEKVRRVVEEMTVAGAALSAVWLQDWTGQRKAQLGDRLWWTWQLDEQRYPAWDAMVDDLAADGVRVLTYVNTWLVDAADKGDDSIRNLFAEAASRGYLVTDPDGEVYLLDQGGFDAALVDLTNVDAREWFSSVIASEVLGQGVDGFMADFGEGLPFDAVLADGDPSFEHNRWPLLWAQTVERACELAAKPGCVTWFRTGSAGMAEHAAMFWSGDQLVTYAPQDGMASALLGAFSAGVSGWHLTHSDVGGYTSIDARVRDYVRPLEMNQRWAEMEAFGVMMRTHEGNRPAENPQVYDTAESRETFARMTRLYAALAPYRQTVVEQAVATGVPALRHTWVQHPGTRAAESDRQFFFGPSILVAPVMAQGASSVEVALPPGTWVHLLTGERYDGDRTVTVQAPLGTPAAFVEESDPGAESILAMVAGADL
jgi:sulfoquinovosidase